MNQKELESVLDKIGELDVALLSTGDPIDTNGVVFRTRANLIDLVLEHNWEHARMHKSRTGSH